MQSFILPANDGKTSPESVKRRRRMAEEMLATGMDTSPIASPWQGAARIANALVGGLSARRADAQEAEGTKSARDAMAKALMGGDKASMIDAMSNPWMDNASLQLVGNAWEQANKPPEPPKMVDMGNGQFYTYDQNNPQGGNMFTPPGYQPPPGSRLITGEEATQMGLPPGAYNLDPDGKISAIGGGDTNVNINNAAADVPMIGTIPQGFAAIKDPTSPSGYRMERVQGGPEDNTAANAIKAERQGISQALVLDEIGAAKELIKGESAFSPRTGFLGKIASNIDQTAAGALKNRLETIKANIGFDRLQAMREASPTGGALGPVSDFENRLLQAVMGSLEQAQDGKQIVKNLDRLERIYSRVINEGIPEAEARDMYRKLVTGKGDELDPPDANGWQIEEVQ